MKLHHLQQALMQLRVAKQPAAVRANSARRSTSADTPAALQDDARQYSLAERLARQIRAISRDDPHRRRRLLRCALEACLLAEWGDAAADDPAFQELVDRVQTQIEDEPSLQHVVDDALSSFVTLDADERAPHDKR